MAEGTNSRVFRYLHVIMFEELACFPRAWDVLVNAPVVLFLRSVFYPTGSIACFDAIFFTRGY